MEDYFNWELNTKRTLMKVLKNLIWSIIINTAYSIDRMRWTTISYLDLEIISNSNHFDKSRFPRLHVNKQGFPILFINVLTRWNVWKQHSRYRCLRHKYIPLFFEFSLWNNCTKRGLFVTHNCCYIGIPVDITQPAEAEWQCNHLAFSYHVEVRPWLRLQEISD